jgi:hypothetical protein
MKFIQQVLTGMQLTIHNEVERLGFGKYNFTYLLRGNEIFKPVKFFCRTGYKQAAEETGYGSHYVSNKAVVRNVVCHIIGICT